MGILKVARLGHPVLRKTSVPVPVREIRSARVRDLIGSMVDTMKEYDGVGLAAPQVHVSLRIVVLQVRNNPRYPRAPRVPLTVLINPHIEPLDSEVEEDWEGCLSIPDLRGLVPRYTRVRVEALDEMGKKRAFTAKGFHARVVQHEYDHLQGRVYLDRMTDFSSLSHLTEFFRFADQFSSKK